MLKPLQRVPLNDTYRHNGITFTKVGAARGALSEQRDHLDKWGSSVALLFDISPSALVEHPVERIDDGRFFLLPLA